MIHIWLSLKCMERTAQGLTLHRGRWDSCPRTAQSVPLKHVISGESQEGQRDYCRIWDPSERLVTARPRTVIFSLWRHNCVTLPQALYGFQCAVLWAGTDCSCMGVVCVVFSPEKRLVNSWHSAVRVGWGSYLLLPRINRFSSLPKTTALQS